MDSATRTARGRQFDSVAEVYARTRPGYPEEAVGWLVGPRPGPTLELGAGTGKLTASLAATAHLVVASEPSPQMIAALAESLSVPCVRSGAESLPFATDAFDVVAVAQAFHWFDTAASVPEIARVLRPGGTLAMIWNFRDERTPWARRLSEIIGSENFGPAQPRGIDWLRSTELGTSGLFGPIEQHDFTFEQALDREALLGLVASRSYVIALPDDERADVLHAVGELYDATATDTEPVRLPYVTECYRTSVVRTSVVTEPSPTRRNVI